MSPFLLSWSDTVQSKTTSSSNQSKQSLLMQMLMLRTKTMFIWCLNQMSVTGSPLIYILTSSAHCCFWTFPLTRDQKSWIKLPSQGTEGPKECITSCHRPVSSLLTDWTWTSSGVHSCLLSCLSSLHLQLLTG